jgi:gluconolactonase
MYELTPPATMPTVFRSPSANANGNAVGADGALYTCEHSGKRIAKTVGVQITTLVGTFGGKALNSPNDVIVRADGTVYFTDPNYAGDTQAKQNVFRATPAGALSVVDDTIEKPNGIALSPDQKLLYVASAAGNYINTYEVAADGSTSNKKQFTAVIGPDGIAVDDAGNLYVASTKVEVFRPDGMKLGDIPVAERPSNIAFGGADRKTLYITAQTRVYEVKVNVAGPP